MAFTQEDLDAVNAALASGVSEIEFADGRRIRYQSADALLRLKKEISDEIGGRPGRQRIFTKFTKGVV